MCTCATTAKPEQKPGTIANQYWQNIYVVCCFKSVRDKAMDVRYRRVRNTRRDRQTRTTNKNKFCTSPLDN